MRAMSVEENSEGTNTTTTIGERGRRRFEGKVAIITESNCGIDRATAILLGKEGAKVTIQGTEETDLRRTIVQMVHADVPQDDILVVEGAIDNDQTLTNLVEKTYNKFGRIDVLVNNAGGLQHQQQQSNSYSNSNYGNDYSNYNGYGGYSAENGYGSAENGDRFRTGNSHSSNSNNYGSRYPGFRGFRNSSSRLFDGGFSGRSGSFDNDVDLLFNINLKSITKLTRLCAPYLEETKGSVVNVSSFGTQRSLSDYTYYSTIKTALDNYCRSIATKFAKRNIRVNNINPGFITGETLDDDESRANRFELNWIKNHVPMGRGGTAEEIAKVVAFLASDDASYITGATIIADGAMSIASKPADFF